MNLSDNAKAILLLCARLSVREKEAPLTLREYNALVHYLLEHKMDLQSLFSVGNLDEVAGCIQVDAERLSALLGRGVLLGFALEAWERASVWVVCRCDSDYPGRLKSHLNNQAPAFLIGTGNRELLRGGGFGVVGSRNVDASGTAFAGEVARWCAKHGELVVSGGARGVDSIAMQAALDAGGVAVGVLADSLMRASVSKDWRKALSQGRLLLLSPYHPEAGFHVGQAMGRNKLIYAMSDAAVVVSAEHKKGGTWAGAEEELERPQGRPVFVRLDEHVPTGNSKLLDLGARPFVPAWLMNTPKEILRQTPVPKKSKRPDQKSGKQLVMEFDIPVAASSFLSVSEKRETYPAEDREYSACPISVYKLVLPYMQQMLKEPLTKNELAELFLDVSTTQVQSWLNQAIKDQLIVKKGKPIKYTWIAAS